MTETIFRLKSDNMNCWASERAYNYITATMSADERRTHRARKIQVPAETLDWYGFKVEYIDITQDEETVWWIHTPEGKLFVQYYD